ncbi:hypothetical protein CB1_001402041 [Camelus ferus]|nr:hypothetical protein CB1_001402041 [Camelus ferus]
MKKNPTVQGTFSKLFGKKHANPSATSLYAANPPWIFTQEAPEVGTRNLDGIYFGDNRFDTVSESGTATLKSRPRVRPLLTFLPLVWGQGRAEAQFHMKGPSWQGQGWTLPQALSKGRCAVAVQGVAVAVAEAPGAVGRPRRGASTLVNGNLRLYSSMGDLRPGHYGQDAFIPPPPPGPAPPPPLYTREDRCVSHRPGPTTASQGKESKKGPRLPEKEAPTSLPEKVAPPSLPQKEVLPGLPQETPPGLPQKEAPPSLPQKEVPPSVPQESPCSLPEREAATGLSLPPVDYIPQDSPTPSVRQIRNKLEARFSLSAEKEAKPSTGLLPPKPRLEGVRIFENRAENGKFSKPVAKNPPAPSTTPLPTTPRQSKAMPGPATPPKATPEPVIPSLATTLPTTLSQLTAEKNQVPARQGEKPEGQGLAVPSKPETEGRSSEASKPPTQEALSSPALPTKISPSREEVTFLYKPHRSQNSPGREVAVVMPTLSRGEAAGSGEPVEVKEPQGLPAKPQASAQPADQLLRHPVTGEVVERGSPMALLLAARQRAQKGRPRRIALGRSSLPGSLRVHSQPEAGSDVIYSHSQPNSFTVVPKISKETEDPQLTSPGQPKGGDGEVLVNQLQILTSSPPSPRSPHGNAHYGSSINTFTVRPGTRHPISYAYSGAHRKAPS